MKLETLAKRIATKTDCPELGHYLLTGELPEFVGCILWTGSVYPKVAQLQFNRHWDGTRYPVWRQPSPKIGFKGKHHRVSRLMYELVNEPDPGFPFRIFNICENPLCLNPRHWEIRLRGGEVLETPSDEPDPVIDPGWTVQDVEEMLEMTLETNPKNWDEIMDNEMMEGAPPDLVKEFLIRFNKEHLTQ